jgi:hypothetical protein
LKAGRASVDGYVVSGYSQAQYDEFIRRDNTLHGKSLSEEEIIEGCVEHSRLHGDSLTSLNERFFGGNGTTYKKMVCSSQRKTVADRLSKKGVSPAKFNNAQLERMHAVVDDNVLRDIAMMAHDYRLSTEGLNEIVTAVGRKNSERERKEVVTAKKAELDERVKGVPAKTSPNAALRKQVTAFKRFLEIGNDGGEFPPVATIFSGEALIGVRVDIDAIVVSLKKLKEKR